MATVKCAHCKAAGADFRWTLTACADDTDQRVYFLCGPCDVELNRLALTFFNDPHAAEKLARYTEAA